MLFNSVEFLIFFLVSTAIYYVIPHKFRLFFLLAASCVFYMSLIPYYILFVAVTALNDYSAGILIEKYKQKKKYFLLQSLIVNIGILFIFKYYNFFSGNIENISKLIGWNYSLPLLEIILPIGLSFYIFKSIAYVVEVYNGRQKAEKKLSIYILYVLFYPEILAGPIDRPQNLLHQFYEKHDFNYNNVSNGLKLMALGIFKKIVIADRIAVSVNYIYGHLPEYSGMPLLICAVFFSFQLYFDFSGYSDIAIGAGKVLGFNLPQNFNKPYLSQSITEFWRRWHISLSTWLRDYLYTPMAIATRNWGTLSIVFSLIVTFVLAGLWHGAGWTFIIFGLLHGIALVYEALTRKFRKKLSAKLPVKLYNLFCTILAFVYVTFAFIFFRSESFAQAVFFISRIFTNFKLQAGGYNLVIGQFEVLLTFLLISSVGFIG